MIYSYKTSGTCSRSIDIQISDNGIIEAIRFNGGCAGNTGGIASLVRGMKISEVAQRLRGIQCGTKGTSCPDQLAQALEQIAAQLPN